MISLLTILFYMNNVNGLLQVDDKLSFKMTYLPKNISYALKDIAVGLPTKTLTIVRGNTTNISSDDVNEMMESFNKHEIQVINFDFNDELNKKAYHEYLSKALDVLYSRTSVIFCEPDECETILEELTDKNFIHRNILYTFFWDYGTVTNRFLMTITEAIRVAVLTNPRENVFRIYYNQASPDKLNYLRLVNWWSGSLYKSPALPPPEKIYHDFKGRVFQVPVIHAPPWHFLQFSNDSTFVVSGGRDDKLLAVLAEKLNFRYQYYDPPDRSQGSGISTNGTFNGILGLIWKRKADFYIGDVTMTWERLQGVEYSFLTLADSGAFLTHAPSKLNEALALIRPFKWNVWPIVVATLLIAGPALWLVIAAPALWSKRYRYINQTDMFTKCCWFTTTLFLRQSAGKEPSTDTRARLVAVLVSLGATYVIGDMYSANLTSLMATPARESPIGTLLALEEAMRDRGYQLLVERYSSSLSLLENGTGVYGRLARLWRQQRIQKVGSVERGVRMVLQRRTVAVLGGRETLYFDTKRFGANNFHLSEKLYTRYSAIALQIGCPYIENFNDVLMRLFEAGILTKMTSDEYEKLGDKRTESVAETEVSNVGGGLGGSVTSSGDVISSTHTQTENTRGLEPVSLRMLRGAFILLGLGHILSGITFAIELKLENKSKDFKTKKKVQRKSKIMVILRRWCNIITNIIHSLARRTVYNVRRRFSDTSILSFEYIE